MLIILYRNLETMYIVDKQYISDDIADKHFVCNLQKCKGACCVEGDSGAPLSQEETEILDKIFPIVKPYLSPDGLQAIQEQGEWVIDEDDDFTTPLVKGKHCAYAFFEQDGTAKCGIEKAFLDGKVSFRKPISCHLFPIRITVYEQFEALNYSVWDICDPACKLGEELGIEMYKFLKEPLVRKYGQEWYETLCFQIEERKAELAKKSEQAD